nr:MAG TPA: hypothetical protein [Caudoviricetes sp.]
MLRKLYALTELKSIEKRRNKEKNKLIAYFY